MNGRHCAIDGAAGHPHLALEPAGCETPGTQGAFQTDKLCQGLWLSPISTWEALTLHATGRIRLHGDLGEWMASATAPFREAPLAQEIARELNLAHQDPTDGFLAATALVLDLTLVTADSELLGLGEIATLANC